MPPQASGILERSFTPIEVIWLAVALLTAGLLALFAVCVTLVRLGNRAFENKDRSSIASFLTFVERTSTLKMTAIIGIIMAVSFLGLFRLIESNGVVGILSGIGGYVLGSIDKSGGNPHAQEGGASEPKTDA
jgi:hypothetical protein